MHSKVRRRPLDARYRVAVNTSSGAGLVHADVFAFDTATSISLAVVCLELQVYSEDLLD